MSGFAIVLTFVAVNSVLVQQIAIRCPDLGCVHRIESEAHGSPLCTRLRAWAYADFAPLDGLRTYVWPPFIDWQKT